MQRAHHAAQELTAPNVRLITTVFGLATTLRKLIARHRLALIAVIRIRHLTLGPDLMRPQKPCGDAEAVESPTVDRMNRTHSRHLRAPADYGPSVECRQRCRLPNDRVPAARINCVSSRELSTVPKEHLGRLWLDHMPGK